MKIIAVVVAYNPNVDLLKRNVDVILHQVDKLYIIDNTEYDSMITKHIKSDKVAIISLLDNVGIAKALNIATKEAINEGADWILSFDQDSSPSSDYVDRFRFFLENSDLSIGQIGPLYTLGNRKNNLSETVQDCEEIITSGSFIRKDAFLSVGGYKEELFIDSVDTEISWNLRVHGYKVCVVNNIILNHCLGTEAKDISIFGRRIMTITNHGPLRYYYMCRNAYYISDLYKKILGKSAELYRYKGIKILIKVLLFESGKIDKVRAIFEGYFDYKKNIMGKK